MQLLYKLSADLIVLLHLFWIVFLIFGAAAGVRYRWAMWLHLGGLGFSLLLQFFSAICPLTYLEVWLRERHDPSFVYPGSFIAHYAEKLVYLEVDPVLILWLTVGAVMMNLLVYAYTFGLGKFLRGLR